ncbi:MAG: hypothetical protein MJA83_05590 [Gammaproteobacteria bacterium]|nr:hypothetical protein [Gammaproteobacteria bacterium]
MILVLENTTKAEIRFRGLVLEPGENRLTGERLELWKSLRRPEPSSVLIKNRIPRWPAVIENLMSNGYIRVKSVTGADDREARRSKGKKTPSLPPKPKKGEK